MSYLKQEVRRTVELALNEDRAAKDITSQACISSKKNVRADFILKKKSRVAGIEFLPWICEAIDPHLNCQLYASDGKNYESETILASIEGSAHLILAGERTALNLLQHASGIADLTAQYVDAVRDYVCEILDTRKTIPGLRAIQKYAVTAGGGKNHRFHLEDRFLIKNNHLRLLEETVSHPVKEAVWRARQSQPQAKIEIEVENLFALEDALDAKAEMIMLDNMPVKMVEQAVAMAKGKAYLEASGGITLANVREYAATGVDGISIGALTHSVTAVDISLRIRL